MRKCSYSGFTYVGDSSLNLGEQGFLGINIMGFAYKLAPSVRRRAARKPTAQDGAEGAAIAAP